MSISEDDNSIISNYVAIAPNEYVTKYSFNRNFEKLVYNDDVLTNILNDTQIETYNKNKTYDKDKIVFYKIQKTDPTLYVLSSLVGPNMHKPLVRKDLTTEKLHVINSEYWAIIGALDPTLKGSETAKDTANNYISNSNHRFINYHQNNFDLDAHPTGKLGMKESSILFRTFDNISDNREHFHYPYELRSYIANDSIYSGYMRKWDNGILEYDLIFRLSYAGKADDGTDLISANNYNAVKQNQNFIYFKNDNDYGIFNQGGDYYVNINGTKQVNLNTTINAYSSNIEFLEPFKDTNYMIFTSNVKNAETKAYNTKNEVIKTYDNRLVINGLTIIDTTDTASFRQPVIIPNAIKNIKSQALGSMEQVNGYPVIIQIPPESSNLLNIDNEAFIYSEITTISLPYSLRYIGKNAFADCSHLTSIIFYIESDVNLQPRIDLNAFIGTNIDSISVIYRQNSDLMTAVNNYTLNDQYDDMLLFNDNLFHNKFYNSNYLNSIGIYNNPTIYVENAPNIVNQTSFKAVPSPQIQIDEQATNNVNDISNDNIITINVDDFLNELQAFSTNQQRNKASMMFRANRPIESTIQNVFLIENGIITGYDDSLILSNAITFNLQDDITISGIGDNALANFTKLTELSIGPNITTISPNAFGYEFNKLVLNSQYDFNLSDSSFNTLCICNLSNKLTVDYIENCYYCGIGDKINAESLSVINEINNLYINNVSDIQSSAFINIPQIQNVYINSNNFNTTINGLIFNTPLCIEYDENGNEEDSWYELQVDNIQLMGNSFNIQPSAFMGIDQSYLSIDLSGSAISSYTFLSGDIDTLELLNLEYANYTTVNNKTYKGLYSNSLRGCGIINLMFSDINQQVSALSTNTYLNQQLSVTGLSYPCVVTTSAESIIYQQNNKFETIPNCLSLDSTHTIILSCTNSKVPSYNNTIYIPNYISAIADDAFKNCNSIEMLYIPSSMKRIGDNAFKNCTNLENISFALDIQLEYIGNNIFQGCSALESIHIPS